MAKIPRVTQPIFAGSAANNGQFGSAQAGTKLLTNDLPTIMGLSAWAQGWLDAVIGGSKFPPLEEFQALAYVETTQIAYLLQEGIAEYDSGSTYYLNGIVKKPGTMQLFGSLTNANQGNALPAFGSNNANWQSLIDLTNPLSGALKASNNLSDVASAATSRTNLGLGTASTHNVTDFLQPENNLSDVNDPFASRVNLFAAPSPISNSGVGQFVGINTAGPGTFVIPSGGTWAYFFVTWNAGTVNVINVGCGIAAGGSTITTTVIGTIQANNGGFAWRIA